MALCSHASSSCDAPCQVYMESWLLKTLNEKLVALPFECALQTAQFVMTLGEPRYLRPIPSLPCVPSPSRKMVLSCGLAVRTGAEGVREAPLPSHAALTIAFTLTLSRFCSPPYRPSAVGAHNVAVCPIHHELCHRASDHGS